jgi:hypothetical protein
MDGIEHRSLVKPIARITIQVFDLSTMHQVNEVVNVKTIGRSLYRERIEREREKH